MIRAPTSQEKKTKALIDSTSENPWERAKTIDPKTVKKRRNESALIVLKKEMNMKKTLSYRAKRSKGEREREGRKKNKGGEERGYGSQQ